MARATASKEEVTALLLSLALAQEPRWAWTFRPTSGLQVSIAETPWIRGSWFQVYEADWTKGYLGSQSSPAREVEKTEHRIVVEYGPPEGAAVSKVTLEREGDELVQTVTLKWSGDHEIRAEICHGMLWTPATAFESIRIDGRPSRRGSQPMSPDSYETRKIGVSGADFAFQGPLGEITASTGSDKAILFDADGYDQPWARPRKVLWFGEVDIPIPPQSEVTRTVRWRVKNSRGSLGPVRPLEGRWESAPIAKSPPRRFEELIPRPKTANIDHRVRIAVRLGTQRDERFAEYIRLIQGLWDVQGHPQTASWRVEKTAEVSHPEGYEIGIGARPDEVTIRARTEVGLLHAQRSLALLTHPYQGELTLPVASIKDHPSIDWRGVHLFVGPTALELHRRLFGQVLSLYKVNQAVLQCERTDWKSQPRIKTSMTMSREDLAAEFQMLRSEFAVEPIPLIQSWGHMGWLFENGENRHLAWNPEVPFAIDPRKPEAREAIREIWQEALALLHPKTIHFGLDEVNLRGGPDDPSLVTELWRSHLGWLLGLSAEWEVDSMLWSDMMLAPGEAIDATHGDSIAEATQRREPLTKGTWIADWHYRAESDPRDFERSLNLWQSLGMKPVAAGWYRPENIRGLTHAAIRTNSGYLQTTWAGYESNLPNLTRDLFQFSAMVLALDYAWSGREELPHRLPYDPVEVFVRRFFLGPRAVRPVPGEQLVVGENKTATLQAGDWVLRNLADVRLGSTLDQVEGPRSVVLTIHQPKRVKGVVLGLSTGWTCDEGENVARLILRQGDKVVLDAPLQYGRHVRSLDDNRFPYLAERDPGGPCAASFTLDEPATVDSIELVAASPYAGVRLHGITMTP